ncbi:MAG: ATP-binding protein [Caulobacterales bacterium]
MIQFAAPIERARALVHRFDQKATVFHRLFLLAATMTAPLATLAGLYWTQVEAKRDLAGRERAAIAEANRIWTGVLAGAQDLTACAGNAPAMAPDACANFTSTAMNQSRLAQAASQTKRLLDPALHASGTTNIVLLRALEALESDAELMRELARPRAAAMRGAIEAETAHLQIALNRLTSAAGARTNDRDLLRAFGEIEKYAARYSTSARNLANGQRVSQADFELFSRDRDDLLAAVDRVWARASQNLVADLERRDAELDNRVAVGLLSAILVLMIAAAVMAAIGRSIVDPQKRLVAAMRSICEGDLRVRVPFRGYENEAGEISRAVEIFRAAMIDRQMLAEHLELERSQLERKVEERTREVADAAARAEHNARQLAVALSTANAGVWGIDLENGRQWLSPEAEAICGFAPSAGRFSDGPWGAIAPEDRVSAAQVRERFFNGVDQRVDFDFRIRRPEGAIRWIRATMERIDSNVALGLLVDVTERKQQELRLQAASLAAEAANRAKSEFLAMMSHEIRTPLNGMLGMGAALEATPLSARQREMVAVINQSGDVLLTLLKDVLDLSKIEAGSMALESAPFDPAGCVRTVAALFGESARAKGLEMRVSIAPDVGPLVTGDPLRVRQILQNLVSNAVKFTDAGHIEMRLIANTGPLGAPSLRFEVEDTGCGLSTDQLNRVFERFTQAEASITRRFGGTGLGLSICRNLANLMGGDVGVASAPGQGSTFWFEAPFEPARTAAPASPVEDIAAIETDLIRILAADDNEVNRLVLQTLLEQIGAQAEFVANGAQAVEAAATRAFDVILMDIHMPVMDGIEATRRIRASGGPNASAPIVALTADAMPAHVEVYRTAGMNDVVPKPVKPGPLLSAILRAAEAAVESGANVGQAAA